MQHLPGSLTSPLPDSVHQLHSQCLILLHGLHHGFPLPSLLPPCPFLALQSSCCILFPMSHVSCSMAPAFCPPHSMFCALTSTLHICNSLFTLFSSLFSASSCGTVWLPLHTLFHTLTSIHHTPLRGPPPFYILCTMLRTSVIFILQSSARWLHSPLPSPFSSLHTLFSYIKYHCPQFVLVTS